MATKKHVAAFAPETVAKQREAGEIPIGDRTFRPVRFTAKKVREMRALARETQAALDGLDVESDEYQDAALASSLSQIGLLLVDADGIQPDAAFLEEHLDTRDIAPLMRELTGGDDDEDPSTQATEIEATSS